MRHRVVIAALMFLLAATGCAGGQALPVAPALPSLSDQPAPASPPAPVTAPPAGAAADGRVAPEATAPGPAAVAVPKPAPGPSPAPSSAPSPGLAQTQEKTPAEKPAAPGAEPSPSAEPAATTRPRLAILVYHDVDEAFRSDYTITPAHLEAQIQMLLAEGYSFYRLRDVERLLAGGEGLPEKGVMLAFDDGYQSYASKVLPLARKYQVPAVCFVVTKYMAIDIIFGRPHMSTVELAEVVQSGLLELASHSHDSHRTGPGPDGLPAPLLTSRIKQHLAPDVETQQEFEERVLQDFTLSRGELRRLGVSSGLRHFTFPFTARSDDAVRLGQEAGFQYFYVGGEQLVTPETDPTAIPRVHAGAPYVTADVLKETLKRLFAEQ
ncbi:MAG TPA: polysaccharide deacetylase family protein [Symbiobacteriaceae bacterium]|nr:polysaccharide deacetylase family protein [Symbiobacteriaceae bacterium]